VGETLWVDKGKLRECAGIVDACAVTVENTAGNQAVPALALADVALAGSVTVGHIAPLGRALSEAAGDMVTAMRGLAQGLEQAANRFHTVDVVLGGAADGGNGPR
jgi:hypothetical protein